MPASLLDRPQLKVDGVAVTPRQALAAVDEHSVLGQRVAKIIDTQGLVAMTQPDEARFRPR
jgi:hypothetical protein